jgi:hypothetical protein
LFVGISSPELLEKSVFRWLNLAWVSVLWPQNCSENPATITIIINIYECSIGRTHINIYILEDGPTLPEAPGTHEYEGGEVLEGMYAEGCTSLEESRIHGQLRRAGGQISVSVARSSVGLGVASHPSGARPSKCLLTI